jgi:hypothetical protein
MARPEEQGLKQEQSVSIKVFELRIPGKPKDKLDRKLMPGG